MKKVAAALFLFALCLGAADFWQSKPYTDWNDKELQKIMNNSPWARSESVSMSGPTAPAIGSTSNTKNGDDSAPAPISEGGGGRGRGGGGGAAPLPQAGGASVDIVARWQSALPVKEAFVRFKYHAEAASAPEAKAMLDREETNYQIVLSGPMRPLLHGTPEELKKALGGATFLSSKGKGAMKPADVQISPGLKSMDVLFSFPRTMPYSLDDKEVEFSTRVGDVDLRYRFRLKDMVFNGKLEL
jgi:hypothetical protein